MVEPGIVVVPSTMKVKVFIMSRSFGRWAICPAVDREKIAEIPTSTFDLLNW